MKNRPPNAEAHARARDAFWNLSPEGRLQRMRAAGVVGVTPHLGDKVRVVGALGIWHYGIVVGVDRAGRVHVAHNDKKKGVVVQPLEVFASSQAVQMVQRAPAGLEHVVAARAMERLGKRYDLLNFNCEHFANFAQEGQASSPQLILGGLLAAFGLAAAAVVFSDDRTWDERMGRYRDARGQFA